MSVKKIKKPSPYVSFLIFLWVIVVMNSSFIGKVEGYYFPVVENFNYTIDKTDDISTTVSGEFDKIRPCDFNNLKWYVTDPISKMSGEVEVSFENQFVLRKEGHHTFSNWVVYNNKNSLEGSKIYAEHGCHLLWNTITELK